MQCASLTFKGIRARPVLLRLKTAGSRAYRHDRGVAEPSVFKHGIVNSKPRKGACHAQIKGHIPA
jgi:hypothetical protein